MNPVSAASPAVRSARRWPVVALIGVVIVVVAGTLGYRAFSKQPPLPANAKGSSNASTPDAVPEKLTVEILHPHQGGIDRVCVQPGTVEAIASADLYAKVSGFLAEQSVDIGSKVKEGQVLARISVPENEMQVRKNDAELDHVKTRVKQAEAKVLAAEAEARAAKSVIIFNEALASAKTSYKTFRKKQLERMRDLLAQNAVDARTVDESQDQYESALSSEIAAKESVNAAKLQAESAEAKVALAKADLEESRAQVRVADAELSRSKVLLSYSIITSPYDGVVTRRGFFPGDFIRAADGGSDRKALFTVEKTDSMRVVIQVPDRDVRFLNPGDPAKLEIDALPGQKFEAVVARMSGAEDPLTRSMQTEVDVPNPKDELRRGMYGRATLLLEPGAPNALTVPTSALEGKVGDGHASARIVRNGKAYLVPVRVGTDNGINVEVLEGLKPDDSVIVRSSGPLEDGVSVEVVEAKR